MAGYEDYRSKRERALQRWGELKLERSSWMSHYRELSHFFSPRMGRFFELAAANDPNRGDKKHGHLLDSTPLRSVRVLGAGLMSGMTSPARPWFRLQTPYDDLNERQPVKQWLHTIERRMRDIFAASNTYRTFRMIYKQLSIFGTGSDFVLPDFQDVIRHYPMATGEYAIDVDDRGVVNTTYRQFEMSVGQIVKKFSLERCSLHVRNLYSSGRYGVWQNILHVVEPRREQDASRGARGMPWKSCYYEMTGQDQDYLSESGFRRFRGLFPRWELENPGDILGSSPGMEALGDQKQLQHEQFRKSQGIDYMTLPALQIPSSKAINGIQTTPGAAVAVDVAGQGVKPMWDVHLNLDHLLMDIQDVRVRLKQAFYEDLFLFVSSAERQGGKQPPSPREVSERHEEKLIMLGPVLESLHDELLSPFIELVFADMIEAGLVPPPPRDLQGQPLVIHFVSLLAQAQRLVGLGAVDRLVGTVIQAAAIKPNVADKIDFDQAVDVYADMLGVDPDIVVANDQVALIRADREQKAAAASAAVAAPDAAKAAKDFSEADPGIANAAVQALQSLGGV